LKGITLPAEHVIGMSTIGATLEAPDEWVGGARCPHAVELGGIPGCLEGDLWHTDRMRCWASTGIYETLRADSVVHMRLVIRAVEVLAVPASIQSLA